MMFRRILVGPPRMPAVADAAAQRLALAKQQVLLRSAQARGAIVAGAAVVQAKAVETASTMMRATYVVAVLAPAVLAILYWWVGSEAATISGDNFGWSSARHIAILVLGVISLVAILAVAMHQWRARRGEAAWVLMVLATLVASLVCVNLFVPLFIEHSDRASQVDVASTTGMWAHVGLAGAAAITMLVAYNKLKTPQATAITGSPITDGLGRGSDPDGDGVELVPISDDAGPAGPTSAVLGGTTSAVLDGTSNGVDVGAPDGTGVVLGPDVAASQ